MPLVLPGCVAPGTESGGTKPAQDRNAYEIHKEDLEVEARATNRLYEQIKAYVHVNVTSFNRNVLISGEVPNEKTSALIEKIVSGVEGVRHVYNELVISGNSSLASRSGDNMISSAVRFRLARDNRIKTGNIKVVTENSTVFLMGNVKRAEADAAANIASATSGVKLVIKLFEYTD